MQFNCIACGKSFKPFVKTQRFCSRSCFIQSRNVETTCSNCGKSLKIQRKRYERSKSHFCGHACYTKFKSINKRQEAAPRWDSSFPAVPCTFCGKIIRLNKWKQQSNRQFCNWNCYTAFRRSGKWQEIFGGENHPLWQGGMSFKRGAKWKELKEIIRKRDNYTCQICGKPESELKGNLHIHHIIPFNCFYSITKANRHSNLTSLCRSCHAREDRRIRNLPRLLRLPLN